MKKITATLISAIILGASVIGNATLHTRDSGLFYDDVLDLTWFRNANYAVEEDSDVPEKMRWEEATDWAAALDYADCTDWRLPSMDVDGDGTIVDGGSVSELLCRDNELAYMFYQNFSADAGDDKSGTVTVDGVTIDNLGTCWSSTDFTAYPGLVYGFAFVNGSQGDYDEKSRLLTWVVADGDLGEGSFPSSSVTWQGSSVTWQGNSSIGW